jgi:hypothetical protein
VQLTEEERERYETDGFLVRRDAFTPEEWELAERFADEWDQKAFDPDYDTLPLEHFEDRVRQVFASAQIVPAASEGQRYAS